MFYFVIVLFMAASWRNYCISLSRIALMIRSARSELPLFVDFQVSRDKLRVHVAGKLQN